MTTSIFDYTRICPYLIGIVNRKREKEKKNLILYSVVVMRKKCFLSRSSFQYPNESDDITSTIYAFAIILCYTAWIYKSEMYVHIYYKIRSFFLLLLN